MITKTRQSHWSINWIKRKSQTLSDWTELNVIPCFPGGLELACRCQLAQIPNLHSRQELSPVLTEKHVIGEGRDKELHSSYSFVIPCYCCLIGKLCLTLCDPMDCSLPGSSVHGILQARILEWAAISFSRGSSPPRDPTCIFCTAGEFFITEATRATPIPCTQAQT